MKALQQIIQYSVLVMAGILLFSLLKEALSCKEHEKKEVPSESTVLYELPKPEAIEAKTAENNPPTISREIDPSQLRLSRYEKLKGKVLLSPEESIERDRILSHIQTIDWLAAQLTNPLLDIDLKRRLLLVDFLEDVITWDENPIRGEAIAAVKGIILSESFLRADNETKRQLIGDKIELFTIVSQESPEDASELLAKVSGTKLEAILKYAAKRLPVNKSKSEE